jgi:prolyl oligopeptidase
VSSDRPAPETDDAFLWLEAVDSDDALNWARARNDESFAELADTERYHELRAQILEALDADDRIPYVVRRGAHLYNFWKDAERPRGLWRRTSLESYRSQAPDWEVLIDVDALAEEEDENWVWAGAAVLRPDHRRALVELSRGGADATVVREFDLVTKAFVGDGYTVAEAKTLVDWIDLDHIYVGTDFGPGTLTSSGYPRIIKRWVRGAADVTSLDEAEIVFEGDPDDVVVYAHHDPTEGYERDFVGRRTDFFSSEEHLLRPDGTRVKIDVPDDADTSVWRDWLLVRPQSAWAVDGQEHRAGSLLAARFDDYLDGDRTLTVLFEPDDHTSLSDFSPTRHHLIVSTLADVKTRMEVLTPPADGSAGVAWQRAPLPGVPDVGEANVVGTDPLDSDEYFLDTQSFTEPSTLVRGIASGGADGHKKVPSAPPEASLETLWHAPSFFDATGLRTRQHFATSDDGTQVPYFVVGPDRATAGPTLLTGYGGFEVPLTPSYSPVVGRGWLARGGTYVVANIRGGGEYGPGWHRTAIRDQRPRAYEDFAAVARDLVDRGITEPAQLGIHGGSNGGLLMGAMLTMYPTLFGAIACMVPLLDMRRYHLLLAGASWMAEYGDPDDPDDWEFLRTYSPYHLVETGQKYPPVLFVTSTRDDRVHPGHARKMMARMAEMGHDVRYYENIEGGHGAAANNSQSATLWAHTFEFLWQRLEV